MSNCSVSSFVKFLNVFLPLEVLRDWNYLDTSCSKIFGAPIFFSLELVSPYFGIKLHFMPLQILFLLDTMLYWDIVVTSVCRLNFLFTGNALYLEAVDFFTWAHLFYLYWFGSFCPLLWATKLIIWQCSKNIRSRISKLSA